MGLRQEGRGSKSHCIPCIAATSGITQMGVSHTGQLCVCVCTDMWLSVEEYTKRQWSVRSMWVRMIQCFGRIRCIVPG